jgi:hypothetical protein
VTARFSASAWEIPKTLRRGTIGSRFLAAKSAGCSSQTADSNFRLKSAADKLGCGSMR